MGYVFISVRLCNHYPGQGGVHSGIGNATEGGPPTRVQLLTEGKEYALRVQLALLGHSSP